MRHVRQGISRRYTGIEKILLRMPVDQTRRAAAKAKGEARSGEEGGAAASSAQEKYAHQGEQAVLRQVYLLRIIQRRVSL